MHDTHLMDKIYSAVMQMCNNNNVKKVNKINIIVGKGSHLTESNLLEFFKDRNQNLVGDWTCLDIERSDVEKLTAIIKVIDGEGV